MTTKISKTNADLAYFNGRLDEVRMSDYDRIRAKAHLARAEAMADAVAALFAWFKRPASAGYSRPTPNAG
jgi:hypothetical protein